MKKQPIRGVLLMSILFLGLQFGFNQTVTGQTVVQDWKMIEESPQLLDVFVSVVQCDTTGSGVILVQIFNESADNQDAHFELTATNPLNNQSFTTEINRPVDKAVIVRGNCSGDPTLEDLTIAIPAGYPLANLNFTVTFIP